MTHQTQPLEPDAKPGLDGPASRACAAIAACGGRVTGTAAGPVLFFEISRYPTGWSKGALPRIEGSLDLSRAGAGVSMRYRFGWLLGWGWLWAPGLMLIAIVADPDGGIEVLVAFTGLVLAALAAYLWVAPLKTPRLILEDLREHLEGGASLGQAQGELSAAGRREAPFPYSVPIPGSAAEAFAFAVEAIGHDGWRLVQQHAPETARFEFQSAGAGPWGAVCPRRTLDLRVEPRDEGGYQARLRWAFHAAWWAVFPVLGGLASFVVVCMRAAAHRPETVGDALGMIALPVGFIATMLMVFGNHPGKPPEYVRKAVLRRLTST